MSFCFFLLVKAQASRGEKEQEKEDKEEQMSKSLPSFPPLSPSAKKVSKGGENEVQVKFTSPAYKSGEEVKGSVLIHCKTPFVAQEIIVKVCFCFVLF